MATLTDEEQARLRAIVKTGMSAHGTRLAGVVGIHFHRHTAREHRFAGKVAMQFGKGPLGGMSVRSALLLRGVLPVRALGALTYVRQVFQADDAVWVLVHNGSTNLMVAILFQPSLSSAQHDESSCGGTSAFLLQPLAQSCIVVRFGPALFAGIEGGAIIQLRGDRQVALTYIDTYHVLMGFGCGRWHLQLKGDKQVELFPGLVIPQFCCPDMRTMLHESKMLLIARVADNDSPIEGEDAHLLIWFQAEIAVVVVGERRGGIFGWLIEALIAFLGDASLACRVVLLYFGPERLVGGSHLARNVTSHLCRQMIHSTHFCIRLVLQPLLIALLATGKRVAAHIVQGVAVGQLRCAQCRKLCRIGMQFELSRDELFHRTSVQYFTKHVESTTCEQTQLKPQLRNAAFLSMLESRRLLWRYVGSGCFTYHTHH